jgi:hypothetical protein
VLRREAATAPSSLRRLRPAFCSNTSIFAAQSNQSGAAAEESWPNANLGSI